MRTIAKGLILSLLALGSAAGTAVAADLPTRKAPPEPYIAPQPMTWTGFYIGVNGGFAGDAFRYPFELGPAGAGGVTGSAKINSSGFLGGVQAGFNWQFAPTWVAGVEGDLDLADITGKVSVNANIPGGGALNATIGSHTRYIDTARLRLGYLITPQFLLYGTGGLAYGETTSSVDANLGGPGGFSASKTNTQFGWTGGAGAEYKLTRNVSFKAEYLYTDLGTATVVTDPFGIPGNLKVHPTDNMVRVGLNYTFN